MLFVIAAILCVIAWLLWRIDENIVRLVNNGVVQTSAVIRNMEEIAAQLDAISDNTSSHDVGDDI